MIIKKFTARTEEEAIRQAKAELGENIVIMNVKVIAAKGLFGFLKKPQVEVTVAREEESERYSQTAAEQRLSDENSLRETFRQVAKAAGAGNQAEPEKSAPAISENIAESPWNAPEPEASGETGKLLVEKLDSLQSMIEKKFQTEETQPEEEEEENSEMTRFVKLLYDTMIENEVDEKYVSQIIDEMEKSSRGNQSFDHALADIYQKMVLKFGKAVPIRKDGRPPRVVFLVGPTGVGKTTTIAKLASRLKLEQKRKVVLMTADTYRIAAAEQLRTYANILEVPFRVIYSAEELTRGVQDFKNHEIILVDMAGHSPNNPVLRDSMLAYMNALGEEIEKEVHLVLSATTKYKDLLSIAESYKDIEDYKLIFTKLDETTTLGNILNLKLHTGAALSYVTCGQNVPDDIETFNPQKTVKQLLGGKN